MISHHDEAVTAAKSLVTKVHIQQVHIQQVVRGLLVAALSLYAATPASGQEANNKQRLAVTHLGDVDEDFSFMGEYLGVICSDYGGRVCAGVQVVPQGDGKFIGVRYACGLPGSGWNQHDREQLEGQREGDELRMSGEQTRVIVHRGMVHVYSLDGRSIGSLQKVARHSPTLGMPAPPNALTLFDGTETKEFKNGKLSEEGWLMEGTELVQKFRDFTLHAEYRLPYMPYARGQGRANSGFYLQSSYEVQVLDSFGLEGVENECGALYRYRRPDVNMCLPPLAWQTYDINFRSPHFDDEGNKIQNARITVLHNGVVVHDDFEIERKTGAGKQESTELWPIKLQDHGNPVRFRNIWLIDLEQQQAGLAIPCVW
jgi:hypothetical protein